MKRNESNLDFRGLSYLNFSQICLNFFKNHKSIEQIKSIFKNTKKNSSLLFFVH